jgi:hypothetical protein
MDSYFSGEISKEDMQAMNQRYDSQIKSLRQRQRKAEVQQLERPDPKSLRMAIEQKVTAILTGDTESEVFSKVMLDRLTVFQDRHMELHLQKLPHVFQFS